MNDDSFPPPPDDEAAVSAYLAGDMDDAEARAFEQRLAAEAGLAARLDSLADALVALRGLDEFDTPAGYEDRLDARLAAERDADEVHGAGASTPPAPGDLAAHRERRDRSRVWLGLGTAAAVLAVGAVMGGAVLRGMGGGGAEEAGTVAGEAAPGRASAESESAAGAVSGPVILDDRVAVADEDALADRLGDVPEAQVLLGTSIDDAQRLEQRYTRAVARRTRATPAPTVVSSSAPSGASAPALEEPASQGGQGAGGGDAQAAAPESADAGQAAQDAPEAAQPPAAGGGSAPPRLRAGGARDPCLAAIRRDARAPLVPVRVESLRYAGERAIAYVFVTAAPGSPTLDRTEVWVVARTDCATLVFQQY